MEEMRELAARAKRGDAEFVAAGHGTLSALYASKAEALKRLTASE